MPVVIPLELDYLGFCGGGFFVCFFFEMTGYCCKFKINIRDSCGLSPFPFNQRHKMDSGP